MPVISRRSFVEKLGLGVGATLLAPIANTLVSEAMGQVPSRKRVVFFLQSNGFPPWTLAPAEFRAKLDAPVPATTTYTWPQAVAPLAPYRNRMMLIDGLSNRGSSQHSTGYGALSCFEPSRGSAEGDGPPGNVTIDQVIAAAICKTTPMKSILCGTSRFNGALEPKVFAAGRDRPIPHYLSAKMFFNRLFGGVGANAAEAAGKRRLLLDSLRTDLKRLNAALATSERRKLDDYTAAIAEYETRQKNVTTLSCATPPPVEDFPPKTALEDQVTTMWDMAALGITCGLSNVMGFSEGCGFGHASPVYSKIQAGTEFESEGVMDPHGHDAKHPRAMEVIYGFNSSVLLRGIQQWEKIKEGDRSILDNTVIVMLSDNGEAHHADHYRFPMVVIGNLGGTLKSDGRYVRYPLRTRALADFYQALAVATGVPSPDRFGVGGREKPDTMKGPLSDVLA